MEAGCDEGKPEEGERGAPPVVEGSVLQGELAQEVARPVQEGRGGQLDGDGVLVRQREVPREETRGTRTSTSSSSSSSAPSAPSAAGIALRPGATPVAVQAKSPPLRPPGTRTICHARGGGGPRPGQHAGAGEGEGRRASPWRREGRQTPNLNAVAVRRRHRLVGAREKRRKKVSMLLLLMLLLSARAPREKAAVGRSFVRSFVRFGRPGPAHRMGPLGLKSCGYLNPLPSPDLTFRALLHAVLTSFAMLAALAFSLFFPPSPASPAHSAGLSPGRDFSGLFLEAKPAPWAGAGGSSWLSGVFKLAATELGTDGRADHEHRPAEAARSY